MAYSKLYQSAMKKISASSSFKERTLARMSGESTQKRQLWKPQYTAPLACCAALALCLVAWPGEPNAAAQPATAGAIAGRSAPVPAEQNNLAPAISITDAPLLVYADKASLALPSTAKANDYFLTPEQSEILWGMVEEALNRDYNNGTLSDLYDTDDYKAMAVLPENGYTAVYLAYPSATDDGSQPGFFVYRFVLN